MLGGVQVSASFVGKMPASQKEMIDVSATGWLQEHGPDLRQVLASDLLDKDLSESATFRKVDDCAGRVEFGGHRVTRVEKQLSLYDAGYFALTVRLFFADQMTSRVIPQLANSLVDSSGTIEDRGRVLGSAAEIASQEVTALLVGAPLGTAQKFSQRYTSIVCEDLTPCLRQPLPALSPGLQREVLALVVRRPGTFDEFLIEGPSRKYQNQSLYQGDFVCATPHNMFVYIPSNRGHLPPKFYLKVYERWRVLTAVLSDIDAASALLMASLPTLPRKLRQLREISDTNGARWIEFMRWRESFRRTPSSVAARAKQFDVKVCEMLELQEMYDDLGRRLGLIEDVITTRYSLALQALLQRYALVVSIFAAAISVVSVLVTVYLAAVTSPSASTSSSSIATRVPTTTVAVPAVTSQQQDSSRGNNESIPAARPAGNR